MAARTKNKAERKALVKLALVVLFGLGAGAALFFGTLKVTSERSAGELSSLQKLITQDGRPFDPQTLNGRYALMYFGFTYCPDACPTALFAMAAALKTLPAAPVQPVFVSVDPQRDTPKVLADYLSHYGPNIIGLTGTPADVQRALRSFGVIAIEQRDSKSPNGYTVDHSNEFLLWSPQGKLLERIPGGTSAEQLAQIVEREIRAGR